MRLLKNLKQKIFKSEFFTNVSYLIFGTVFAQAIPIVLSPIISRLYNPAFFAFFTIFNAVVNIGAILSTGKYESVFFIEDKGNLKEVLGLLIVYQFVFIIIWTIGINLFIFCYPTYYYLIFSIFSILFWGIYSTFFSLLSVEKKFKILSVGKIIKGVIFGIGSLILGWFGWLELGLIFSFIIGQFFELLYITQFSNFQLRELVIKSISKPKKFLSIGKKYKNFPQYFMSASLFFRGTMETPIYFLSKYLTGVELGNYGLMRRVTGAPVNIITSSLSNVIRQKVGANILNVTSNRNILLRYTKFSFLIGIIPFIIIMFWAKEIFGFVFGEEWQTAGIYLQTLAPIYFMQLIVNPLGSITVLREKQKEAFLLHFFHFLFTIISFSIGFWYYQSFQVALNFYVFVYCLKYVFEFYLAYKYSIVSD